ncbi:MAG: serine hydrolase [Clostridia bacterium]|nr:serine hydrolase [Clostridia bacterium]
MQQLPFAARPEDAGVSSQGILDYIAAREDAGLEHHAIWVIRHGQVACRLNYAPYDDETPHMLFSLSKSFCSAAAGFAVAEGLLAWDTKAMDVLPEAFPPEPSAWLQSVTLHHLLTMGSGLKPESDGGSDEPGWAQRVLSFDCDHEPGTHFAYNSMSTYLVSCMVQKVTGMTVRDYLTPRLFAPLDILKPDGAAPDWDESPDGVNVGGWGLWLSCSQIARFGQCLLQRGVWDGVQVLPREWLDLATTARIDNGNGDHPHDHDWNMGYGYQFWMCKTDHEPGQTPRYRGDGMFSQFCIVDEKRDMVVCCVSGVADIGKALELIYAHLLAAADMEPADEIAQAALQRKLATLCYPWPEHDGGELPVGVYRSEGDGPALTIEAERVLLPLDGDRTCLFHPGRAEEGGGITTCCGMQDGVLRMLARPLRVPFTLDITCRFAGDACEMTMCGVGQEGKTFMLHRK